MDNSNIVRYRSQDPFARIPKSLLDDEELSWKAKGILCYLLGKPNNWKAQVRDITNHGPDGPNAVRSGLMELRKLGYARLESHRNGGQILGFALAIADCRKFDPNQTKAVLIDRSKSATGVPDRDFPHLEKPHVENQYLNKKERTKNEKKKRQPLVFELPESLNTKAFNTAWTDWLEDRRERKKPVTKLAAKLQLKKCEAWGVEKAITYINTAIEKGWSGLFEPNGNHYGKVTERPNPRLAGVCRGPTNYGEAAKRIQARQAEERRQREMEREMAAAENGASPEAA